MCRMILARGKFQPEEIVTAAIKMSEGVTACDDSPIHRHPNGWGAIWKSTPHSNELQVHRSLNSLSDSYHELDWSSIKASFLALHVRHATLKHTLGLQYTHPIMGTSQNKWYLLHNGFLPTIYSALQREKSCFDSKEYYDYIIPSQGDKLNSSKVIQKLNNLKQEGTSANAFIMNLYRAYVIHWNMPQVRHLNYFSLYHYEDKETCYVSSEIQSHLASEKLWKKIPHGSVYEISI